MNKTRSPRTIILLLIRTFLLTASILLLANLSVVQAQINPPACTKVKLPGPNLRAFLDTLVPGDVGCLRAGEHGARGTEAFMTVSGTPSAPITLRGYTNDPRPTILGYFPIGGDNIVISGLLFDGPTGLVNSNPNAIPPIPPRERNLISIYGDNVEINHCKIRKSLAEAGIYLQDAYNARIIGNYIYDNGRFGNANTAYQDHGIYFGSGSGLIANNIIEHNWSYGIQLYPSASNVIVQQNTIVKNVQSGIIIGGWTTNCPNTGCPPQPTNTLVVNNIIAFNGQYAFRSFELTTTGHIIKNNILWGNAPGDIPTDERLTRNLTFVNQNNNIADPRFVGTSDYHLQSGSPAIDAALNPYTQPDDYDFVPRPQGAASDIGAFEHPIAESGYEADVAQRPNGDGSILSDDVVQVRRFLNGTNTPSTMPNEFQRADSAPFAEKGDGLLNSADVVQTRRYQNGTSPLQTAGGPLQPGGGLQSLTTEVEKSGTESKSAQGNLREVQVESTTASAGQMVTVNILVDAVGDEAEYGFILNYDTNVLSNPVIREGKTGASVRSCNTTTKPGQISCSVGGFAGNNTKSTDSGIGEIGAGNNQILMTVTFTVAAKAAADAAGDTPLKLSNVNAASDAPQLFTPGATDGMVTILAAARDSISDRVWQTNRGGAGVIKARVELSEQNGDVCSARTNPFGYYQFTRIKAGGNALSFKYQCCGCERFGDEYQCNAQYHSAYLVA